MIPRPKLTKIYSFGRLRKLEKAKDKLTFKCFLSFFNSYKKLMEQYMRN